MNPSANVRSLDVLRELRTAIVKFREETSHALTSIDVEIRHTLDWLSHDQLKFWQSELRRREDKVGECKMALARCQLSKNASGETPSCDDEKKQVARAKARVEEAEGKIELVKKWTMVVQQEIIEYRGPAQQLDGILTSKLPVGLQDLDSRIASLEAYLQTMSESVDLGLSASNPTDSNPAAIETKPATTSKQDNPDA